MKTGCVTASPPANARAAETTGTAGRPGRATTNALPFRSPRAAPRSNPPHPSSLVIPVNIGVASYSPDKFSEPWTRHSAHRRSPSNRTAGGRICVWRREHVTGKDHARPALPGAATLSPLGPRPLIQLLCVPPCLPGNRVVPTVFASQLPGHLPLRPPPVGALERDTTCWADVDFSHLGGSKSQTTGPAEAGLVWA